MGLTHTYCSVSTSLASRRRERIRFLVDSGAEYSVIPQHKLQALRIPAYRTVEVSLADGSLHRRRAGEAVFEYGGVKASSPVIFGEEGDEALLGAVTLETLGFLLDPLKRRIVRREAFRL